MLVIQLLLNGLVAGALYALISVGFTLIYSTNRIMHFAHGAVLTAASYVFLQLFAWNVPFIFAIILTLITSGLLGVLMFQIVYKKLVAKKASRISLLIASVAMLLLVINTLQLIFGVTNNSSEYTPQIISFFSYEITLVQLISIVLALIVLAVLPLFTKSKLGLHTKAVANNTNLASIVGINVDRIKLISFFIGSVIVGMAGILLALEYYITPQVGTSLVVKGFTGSVIGGLTSLPGSIIGSFIIGLIENVGIWFLPSGYKDAIAFSVLFIFLLFKPSGLFGTKEDQRK